MSMPVKTMATIAILAALCAGAAGAPDESAVFEIPRMGAIVPDGKADDWGDGGLRVEMLVPDDGVLRPAADLDAQVRLAWNDKGLLLLATVQDDAGAESPSQAGLRTTQRPEKDE